MGRISIARLLGVVAAFALGFAAVRNASDLWVVVTFLMTFGLLCASVVGAVLERGRGGVWWLGFAVFSWAYLISGQVPELHDAANLPSERPAQAIYLYSSRPDPNGPLRRGYDLADPGRMWPNGQPILKRHVANAARIGQWLVVLIFARAGATVSCVFTKGLPWLKKPASEPAPIPRPIP